MNKKLIILLYTIVLSSTFGCVKEKFDQDKLSKSLDNDKTIATPIGYVKNSLEEIFAPQIDSGIIGQDEEKMLWFKFNQDLFTLKVSDLIQYQNIDTSFAIINNTGQSIDLNATGIQVQIKQTFYCDFGFSQGKYDEQIDSIFLNNMEMIIDVIANGFLNADINASFPGILYSNQPYSKDLVVSSSNIFADLMAYTVHLQNDTTAKNRLQIDFTLEMGQTSRIIAPGEKIMDIDIGFSSVDFEILYGYIGQININPAPMQEKLIDIMNKNVKGYFNFDHSFMNLNSKNSFGVPFSFNLNGFDFKTYYKPTNSIIFQNGSVPSETTNISFPTLMQIGQTVDGLSQLGAGIIKLGFQDYYSTISGSLNGTSNPEGQKDYNFVLKNSQLEIASDFALPFWGNTDNLTITDSINFNLKDFFHTSFDKIERLLFIVNFTNALPMNSKCQIYFCDVTGNKLDSLFNPAYLVRGSSLLDAKGKVIPEPNKPAKVEFLADRIINIEETAYLLVKSEITTVGHDETPSISWKFYSDYYFYTHIGVAGTIKDKK